mgnify:FL=1|jgi:hypothetical protein|tara:strand:- start:54 stop:440 length:387 start_codon:yes stop_codon:yes gene_type:complete
MSRRFGAYTRFVKQGYNSDMARHMSDNLYPPTKEDLKYERSRKNPKPLFPIFSLLSLLYPNIATYYFTKYDVTLLEAIGYAIVQTSYVMFVAILFGTFGIFGLYSRKSIFIYAIGCFIVGSVLSNIGI